MADKKELKKFQKKLKQIEVLEALDRDLNEQEHSKILHKSEILNSLA
jgi:hypothetical protein